MYNYQKAQNLKISETQKLRNSKTQKLSVSVTKKLLIILNSLRKNIGYMQHLNIELLFFDTAVELHKA